MDTILHKGENCSFVTDSARAGYLSGITAKKGQKGRGQTMHFNNPVYIIGRSTYVGSKEGKGPLGKYFHKVAGDDKMGAKTFEGAEIKMLEQAVTAAIKSSGKKTKEMDLLLSGDLLNQITSSSFVARDLGIPFIGIYSACSTMTSSLALGASLINAGYYQNIACATSSHFATAERQYRYPLEYGCQRPPYAQWTVTGAACSVLSSEDRALSSKISKSVKSKAECNSDCAGGEEYTDTANSGSPRITMATLGKVVDFGTNDLNNMGAAMAPPNAIITQYYKSLVRNI